MSNQTKKTDKQILRFIIENYGKMSLVAIGKAVGLDHTTVLYWVKKLRKEGFDLSKGDKMWTKTQIAVDELKGEYGIGENVPRSGTAD